MKKKFLYCWDAISYGEAITEENDETYAHEDKGFDEVDIKAINKLKVHEFYLMDQNHMVVVRLK